MNRRYCWMLADQFASLLDTTHCTGIMNHVSSGEIVHLKASPVSAGYVQILSNLTQTLRGILCDL